MARWITGHDLVVDGGVGGARMVSRAEGSGWPLCSGLEPLPDEGGMFRRTYADAHSSAIYYLLVAPDFSALHALSATETYHWYAGAPLRLLLLHPDGGATEPVLGPDLAAGQRPQQVVPAGTWQGSSPRGPGRWWARPWRPRSTRPGSGSAPGTTSPRGTRRAATASRS